MTANLSNDNVPPMQTGGVFILSNAERTNMCNTRIIAVGGNHYTNMSMLQAVNAPCAQTPVHQQQQVHILDGAVDTDCNGVTIQSAAGDLYGQTSDAPLVDTPVPSQEDASEQPSMDVASQE